MVIYEVGQKMMRNEATGHRKLTLKMVFIFRTQWLWRLRFVPEGLGRGGMYTGTSLLGVSAEFWGVLCKILYSDRLPSGVTAPDRQHLCLCASLVFCYAERSRMFGTSDCPGSGE